MDGVRAHRIAGNVVDRHEEKESERTKNDHPWIRREARAKNPRGPIKGKLKGRRKNLSKNRSGSFNADQTPAQLRKRIAELDLWLRELEEIALIMTKRSMVPKSRRRLWNRKMRCRTISQREASRTDRRLR